MLWERRFRICILGLYATLQKRWLTDFIYVVGERALRA